MIIEKKVIITNNKEKLQNAKSSLTEQENFLEKTLLKCSLKLVLIHSLTFLTLDFNNFKQKIFECISVISSKVVFYNFLIFLSREFELFTAFELLNKGVL